MVLELVGVRFLNVTWCLLLLLVALVMILDAAVIVVPAHFLLIVLFALPIILFHSAFPLALDIRLSQLLFCLSYNFFAFLNIIFIIASIIKQLIAAAGFIWSSSRVWSFLFTIFIVCAYVWWFFLLFWLVSFFGLEEFAIVLVVACGLIGVGIAWGLMAWFTLWFVRF